LSFTRLRRLGGLLALAHVAALIDIGSRRVVPGASDNLTAVAVLFSLARWLQDNPPSERVILLSTGSEESFMEGMRAFIRRHRDELDPLRTEFICLETLGSPNLTLVRGEGTLRVRMYDAGIGERLQKLAADLGIHLGELRTRNASDGSISARAGYPTAMLFSVNDGYVPDNYHWPTDTPENVDLETVDSAARLCAAYLDRAAGVP
jgi:Zn-dependent M28 family amino/carboxypeptidase